MTPAIINHTVHTFTMRILDPVYIFCVCYLGKVGSVIRAFTCWSVCQHVCLLTTSQKTVNRIRQWRH